MSLLQYSGTNELETHSWTFEASVLTNQYLYKVMSTNGQEFIFGSEGNDNYSLFRDPEARKRFKMPGYLGYVFSGHYPVWSSYTSTALPWLAYCSGEQMTTEVTNGYINLPAPWLSPWAMLSANIYKVHYKPLDGSAGLPTRLEYIVDGTKLENIKNGFYETIMKPTDSERDKVVLKLVNLNTNPEAVYQVNQTTNYQGVVLPTQFVFDIYVIKDDAKQLLSRMKCELMSVESINELDPLPKSSDETTKIEICDYRFANPQNGVVFLRYLTPNSGEWLTNKLDSRLQNLYLKDVNMRKGLIPVNLPRYTVIVLLFLVTAIPLIILVRRVVRKPIK